MSFSSCVTLMSTGLEAVDALDGPEIQSARSFLRYSRPYFRAFSSLQVGHNRLLPDASSLLPHDWQVIVSSPEKSLDILIIGAGTSGTPVHFMHTPAIGTHDSRTTK
jgi:hypothetical protein